MAEALFIGLDLGGTDVKAGLGDARGELVWRDRRPSHAMRGGEAILEALGAAVEAAIAAATARDGEVRAICLGTPGVVDHSTGRIRYPVANLGGWCGTDIPAYFKKRFGIPAVIENDANAAAWGEYRRGAAQGAHSMVMATVGTGIGGGAVVAGALLRGANGGAMELGHTLYEAAGRACHCGLVGCVEAYAGGRAMAEEWARQGAVNGSEPGLSDLLRADQRGDPLAKEILDAGARALGRGLVSALHLINPEVLVLGGGTLEARPRHFDIIVESLSRSILPKALDGLSIVAAKCGNDAGIIGALELAIEAADA